jgi:hypothetical protein
MNELEKIAAAIISIQYLCKTLLYTENDATTLFDRARLACEACNQPTRDALLMVLSSVACEVMSNEVATAK